MNELALFAGGGGSLLAAKLLGWTMVGAVEIKPYRRKILLSRQRDGILNWFPVWDDVRTFDGRPWKGLVDVVSGGFPCQDVSAAGRGLGVRHGARSGLWREFARIIGEVRPGLVFVENSPLLVTRGLDIVLGDLARLGYDARWCVLGAWHVGAPHKRNRIWVLAYPSSPRHQNQPQSGRNAKEHTRSGGGRIHVRNTHGPPTISHPTSGTPRGTTCQSGWWAAEPDVGRVAHGVASTMDRIAALGDGQVPLVAATAFTILAEGLV